MSQSKSPLRAIIANIVTPANTERALPHLAALADHAFALAHQQAGCEPNNVPSGICTRNRQARIVFSKDRLASAFPIKVVFYQDVPAVQIQRVVVDFQTETVQYEGQPSLPIEMRQIERARPEIKIYLHRHRDTWKSCSYIVTFFSWPDFLKRLESNGISSGQSQVCANSSFFEKPCPSCDVLTALCTSCSAIMCLSWDCPVSRLIPSQSCSRDIYAAACLPCLQNTHPIPPLGQCPECNLWFYSRELKWCRGRPKETPSDTTRGITSSVREHPPKPIVCFYCDLAVSKCSHAGCWSRAGNDKDIRICRSCSPEGGIRCACERHWICDDCKKPPMPDCLRQCPQCKRAFCDHGCKYIGFCTQCERTTACDDCAEEDRSSFAGLDGPEVQEVELVGVCRTDSCQDFKFCEECLEGQRCAECRQTGCLERGGWCRDLRP